jgi:hypothetical protein
MYFRGTKHGSDHENDEFGNTAKGNSEESITPGKEYCHEYARKFVAEPAF